MSLNNTPHSCDSFILLEPPLPRARRRPRRSQTTPYPKHRYSLHQLHITYVVRHYNFAFSFYTDTCLTKDPEYIQALVELIIPGVGPYKYSDTSASLTLLPASRPPSRRPVEPPSTWLGSFLRGLCQSWTPGCGTHIWCEDIFIAQRVLGIYVSLTGPTPCYQRRALADVMAIMISTQTFSPQIVSTLPTVFDKTYVFTVVRKITLCKCLNLFMPFTILLQINIMTVTISHLTSSGISSFNGSTRARKR